MKNRINLILTITILLNLHMLASTLFSSISFINLLNPQNSNLYVRNIIGFIWLIGMSFLNYHSLKLVKKKEVYTLVRIFAKIIGYPSLFFLMFQFLSILISIIRYFF